MIRLARFVVAMPGKTFEVMAALKQTAAIAKKVAGVDVLVFGSLGAQIGEFASVSQFADLADFEEKAAKILASPDYRSAVLKFEGLIVPGSSHEHLLREV